MSKVEAIMTGILAFCGATSIGAIGLVFREERDANKKLGVDFYTERGQGLKREIERKR